MSDLLEHAKEVLKDLERTLEKQKSIWGSIKELNPDFEQLSDKHWVDKYSRCWLHGATDMRESNELEQWLYDKPPLSETATSSAAHCVRCWREWLSIKEAYYEDFEDFEFEEPMEGENLIQFIWRMAKLIEEEGQGARLEWRAFNSFLGYLRKIQLEEVAFIEQIFPKKKDVQHGKIIRLITPEMPAIPKEIAAQIVVELAHRCLDGRPDAQLAAAESLGLCWLCLTSSRLRLPIYLETLRTIKTTALQTEGEYPILQVPTFFGNRPIRISHRFAKFFRALSSVASKEPRDTILHKPLRSLSRSLDTAIKNVSPDPKFGNITYVSLLSPPHDFGLYRYQPK